MFFVKKEQQNKCFLRIESFLHLSLRKTQNEKLPVMIHITVQKTQWLK